MSRMSDAMIGIEDAFETAKNEYDFWTGEMDQFGYDIDNAIAAAQYYGQMVGIAKAMEELVSPSPLKDYVNSMSPRLYKEDYE